MANKPVVCPWCGKTPEGVTSGIKSIIWCGNTDCPVRPKISDYVPMKKLIKRWESWLDFTWMNEKQLKSLRAKINGKLSKRIIAPEQQAKMQAARKKNKPNQPPSGYARVLGHNAQISGLSAAWMGKEGQNDHLSNEI